jgi:hypothetical protein
MRRAALERPRTLRVWRAHARLVHSNFPTDCLCDEQPGRFRKGQRVSGCGKPRCWLCKRAKLAKEPTSQQCRSNLSFREWAVEFGFSFPRQRKRW